MVVTRLVAPRCPTSSADFWSSADWASASGTVVDHAAFADPRQALAELLVLVEQQDRRLVHFNQPERELDHLLEQRAPRRRARQRLRHLQQQRQLEPVALVLRQRDRACRRRPAAAARSQGALEREVGVGDRHRPDDRRAGARGAPLRFGGAVVDQHRAQIAAARTGSCRRPRGRPCAASWP